MSTQPVGQRRNGSALGRGTILLKESPAPRKQGPPGAGASTGKRKSRTKPDLTLDPPLRGRNKAPRKNKFTKRVQRKDPDAILSFKLDAGGWQERTLRIAMTLYDSDRKRLLICAETRRSGTADEKLPLRAVKAKPCSDEVCHCHIDYRKLTAPNLMGVNSSIVRSPPPATGTAPHAPQTPNPILPFTSAWIQPPPAPRAFSPADWIVKSIAPGWIGTELDWQ